jgi:Uma2 family endonuclease
MGTVPTIGPSDNGRRMSLEEFDHADVQEGYLYELSRGVIVASDVPNRPHLAQLDASRQQFEHYRWTHPGRIYLLAGGSDCKILIGNFESERHPDMAVYKSPPLSDENLWAVWIPDIAIEIVSPGSEYRDYVLKREEYWAFGVREYWIIDAYRRELLVLRRGKVDWTEHHVRPPKLYTTRLLPGFAFDRSLVFQAAEAAGLQNGEHA